MSDLVWAQPDLTRSGPDLPLPALTPEPLPRYLGDIGNLADTKNCNIITGRRQGAERRPEALLLFRSLAYLAAAAMWRLMCLSPLHKINLYSLTHVCIHPQQRRRRRRQQQRRRRRQRPQRPLPLAASTTTRRPTTLPTCPRWCSHPAT